jgi:hypothetical protein
MEEVIRILESKGHTQARAIITDLKDHGVFTHADASRYAAVVKFIERIATEDTSATKLVEDIAHQYAIGETTLRRVVAELPGLVR